MLKKIMQAVVAGLFGAALILFFSPKFHFDDWFSVQSDIVSYHAAVKRASPAVVNVYNQAFDTSFTQDGEGSNGLHISNLGSGVIMTADGYILTNKHVVQNADQILVALQTGVYYDAILVGSDTMTDLAVLKVGAENLPTIAQNPKRPVQVGDVVLAIGNPYNLGQSITQGIISATGRNALTESGRQDFIQTDASINKGNSGGALINSAGELIGINTLSLGKDSSEIAEGLNFAIPISLAKKVMEKIIKDGRVIRGYLGVGSDLRYSVSQLDLNDYGVLVTSVREDSPAAKAGILPNDIILQVGEAKANSSQQMMAAIAELAPNSKVKVKLLRQGKPLEFDVVIGEFPEL